MPGTSRIRAGAPRSASDRPTAAAAGYNLVTGLGTPVANLLVPDLIAYQATSPANQTAADLPASSDGSGSGGTGAANVLNVFNVFDVVTVGSNKPSDMMVLGQGADTGSVTQPKTSTGMTLGISSEQDLVALESTDFGGIQAAAPATEFASVAGARSLEAAGDAVNQIAAHEQALAAWDAELIGGRLFELS